MRSLIDGRAATAEGIGTAVLVMAVVGSGIMAERLAGGNAAIALLANSLATGATLIALIFTFAPISGAHLNPAVTLVRALERAVTWSTAGVYVVSQFVGGLVGVVVAHAMFELPLIQRSLRDHHGGAQLLSEFIATFGLLMVVHGSAKRANAVPLTVAAYITAAYWFTSSTSFANPAVTLARGFTNSFSGIAMADVPGFVTAQVAGALAATALFKFVSPHPAFGHLLASGEKDLMRESGGVDPSHRAARDSSRAAPSL